MTDVDLGWRVSWQDYRGWRTRDFMQPRPMVFTKDFASKDDADREARLQRAAGMTVSVSKVPTPRQTGRRTYFPEPDLPRVPKEHRRLTP